MLGLQLSAVQLHDLAADVQAEAHAAEAALGVGLVEAVEDALAVLGRHADAVIDHVDPQPLAVEPRR